MIGSEPWKTEQQEKRDLREKDIILLNIFEFPFLYILFIHLYFYITIFYNAFNFLNI